MPGRPSGEWWRRIGWTIGIAYVVGVLAFMPTGRQFNSQGQGVDTWRVQVSYLGHVLFATAAVIFLAAMAVGTFLKILGAVFSALRKPPDDDHESS